MDAFGNHKRKVSELQLEDSWMSSRHNGREMVVSGRAGKDVRRQLFLVNTTTGAYKQLTDDTNAIYADPSFSPDGRQIAYVYRKNKHDRQTPEEIYLMDSEGKNPRRLSYYPLDDSLVNSNEYKASAPHWHPRDQFISYISYRHGEMNIYCATPDGTRHWRLTDRSGNEGWHDWSDDGQWLVFDSKSGKEGQYHIMLMNWKTKQVQQLTDTTYKTQLSPVFVRMDD